MTPQLVFVPCPFDAARCARCPFIRPEGDPLESGEECTLVGTPSDALLPCLASHREDGQNGYWQITTTTTTEPKAN